MNASSQFDLLAGIPMREVGRIAGEACQAKAESVAGFDSAGAARFMLGWLAHHGEQSGEQLTNAAKEHGYRPHDDRAFGPVYAGLVRNNQIRCVGGCIREKGNGTAGGRLWALVR